MAEDTTKTTTEETPVSEETPKATASTTEKPTTTSTPRKKKSKRSVPFGQMHVYSTFNNTIITFTDSKGGALAYSSAGACGFRGSKKGTAYAAQVATEKAAQAVKQLHGLSKVDVFIKGVGLGREAAVRSLQSADIKVETITDVTGVPHGGCRPRKARRV